MASKIKNSLLKELYRDSFMSVLELANRLEVSRQNISKYLEVIEGEGFIKYTIIENPNIQASRNFFTEIKTNPEEPEIITKLLGIKAIITIDGIIGQNSLIVRFTVRNNIEFTDVLEEMDRIISGSRFQHYKIIECIKTFKDGGIEFTGGNGAGPPPTHVLDANDVAIINILKDFPTKFSYKNIFSILQARGINLAYATVRRKVRLLQERGVIRSFSIKISPGFIKETASPLKFYLQIIPKDLSRYNTLASEILAKTEEIVELYRTGEEYGILAVVRTSSVEKYRDFLEELYRTGEIQDSISTLVIDEKMAATFKPF
ncbi:MAG: Lrp/AsnC ligand binding domain-containing protein [Promethearchaeota archaeon]